MSDPKLGELLQGGEQRDAIHIAIAPIVAAHAMSPGQHVGLLDNGTASAKSEKLIGIVDPFLKEGPVTGERFWLCLYQKSVTGMRHHWQHPTFTEQEAPCKAYSEKWLRDYAIRNCSYYTKDEAYDKFMQRVQAGEIFYYGSDLHGAYELEQPEELFNHLSIVLGKAVGAENFTYSCSC